MSGARESALQVQVREALAGLGGYWRPASAALRLLEELGELAEHALDPLLGSTELAGECADLWIISTALADQFYARVDEPTALPAEPVDGPQQLAELVAAGGRVGRIVNYYDGPKTPRTLDGWISIERAIAALHRHLIAFAATHGVDLRAAIDRTLARNLTRDEGRFGASDDPRTAPVLDRFTAVRRRDDYPFPGETRLFGAPDGFGDDAVASPDAIAPALRMFLRAAPHERLDGFVVELPPSSGTADDIGAGLWRALGIEPSTPDLHGFAVESTSATPGSAPMHSFSLLRPSR